MSVSSEHQAPVEESMTPDKPDGVLSVEEVAKIHDWTPLSRDMKGMKKSHEALRAERDRYRALLDDLMDWRCGIPGHMVAVGCGVAFVVQRVLGFTPQTAADYLREKEGAETVGQASQRIQERNQERRKQARAALEGTP